MKNGILVPLDGTILAEQAIPVAAAIAERTGAELHPVLVHLTDVWGDLDDAGATIAESDRAEEVREAEYLESVAWRLEMEGARVRSPVVLHGDVPDAVVEHVAAHGIGGVVMAGHARKPAARLLSPSVTETLRHRLAVPMVLLRGDPDAGPLERVRSSRPLETVVVGLDGSPDAEGALQEALELVGPRVRLVLLRVVTLPPQLSTVYLPQATILRHHDEERLRADAAAYLTEVAAGLQSRVASVEKRLGVHSRPGQLLARAAHELGADLVAVGSHGRSALREALFGSVTTDVLRESHLPVLITRASLPR